MIAFPNAKINIGLNVVSRRDDGYHDIETVFYPVNVQDALEINVKKIIKTGRPLLHRMMERGTYYEDDVCSLTIKGNALPGNPADNLVVRAYRMMLEDFDLPPIDIMLYKHIPDGAGLGGGSSDCAHLIMLLNRRFGLRMTDSCMERYASRLGADCAFFIRNTPMMATGTGTVMSPSKVSLKGMTVLLVKPEFGISTAEAYSGVVPKRPEVKLTDAIACPVCEWRECVKNDFEEHLFQKYPQLGEIKAKLYETGAVYSAMSGSGSTVYGLYSEPVESTENIFPGMTCIQRTLL